MLIGQVYLHVGKSEGLDVHANLAYFLDTEMNDTAPEPHMVDAGDGSFSRRFYVIPSINPCSVVAL